MSFLDSIFGRREPAMGFRSREFSASLSLENPSTSLSNPSAWLYDAFGASPSYAGPSVSETTAMRQSAVYACVQLISGLMGNLPMHVYERTPGGRKLADGNRLYPLVHDAPSDLMSAFTWKEMIGTNLCLNGNHYSVIERDGAARAAAFIPVPPGIVQVQRVKGRNQYTFGFSSGIEVMDQDDVLHVPGMGFDGMRGLSPIAWAARQPVGLALAMEEGGARLYANGMQTAGTVTMPKGISPEGAKRFKNEIEARHRGLSNSGKPLFLDFGASYASSQILPIDAQTLETRRFQVGDIARIFGVPPHMIGEVDKTTSWGTGIEQQTIGFLIFNLDIRLSRVEAEINRKIFKGTRFYAEYDRDALRALDAMTMATIYSMGVQSGRYTSNEIRRLDNRPDMPGGDQLLIQGSLIPLTKAGKMPKAAPAAPAPKIPNPNEPGPTDPPAPKPAKEPKPK